MPDYPKYVGFQVYRSGSDSIDDCQTNQFGSVVSRCPCVASSDLVRGFLCISSCNATMWRRRVFPLLRHFSTEPETPSPPSLYSFLQPSIFSIRKPQSKQPPNPQIQTPKHTLSNTQQLPNLESTLQQSLNKNNTDEAWKCFKSISSSSMLPSKLLINSLITHLCSVNKDTHNLKRAFATLMFVLEKNPEMLDHKTVEMFLNSMKVATNGAPAFALVKCMFKNRFFVPFGMWGEVLVEISRKTGRFCDFFEVFNESCRVAKEEKLELLRPDLAACNAALEGCCCELESVTDAQKVLETMSLLGVRPDETSFGWLAYLYAIKGLEKKITELEDLVSRFGFSDKSLFVSKMVSGYVKSGNLESVSTTILQNLRAVNGNGLNLHEETYGEIVKGYLEHGSVKGLASLILEAQKLESKTVKVETSVGYGIINACVNLGLLEKAHSVLDEMNAQGGSVGLGVYVSILKAYGKEQRTAEAAQLVSEVCGLGLDLDVSTFDALIDVSMSSQDFQSALSLFRDMREARIPELMGSYLTIMTGLTENHRPELMAAFLDEVVEDPRVKIGTHDWNSIIHAFCKAGRLEDARRTFRRMVFLQFEPTEQTYLSLVNGYMTAGNYFSVLMMWNDVKKRLRFDVMQVVEKSQEMKIFVDKWRYKQVFMENHKKLKVAKLRKRSIKKMEALIAFKNWAGLNS
ncbi:putative tetratricopeptide-like helical domain superfamily [Helianthus annuus]|nr:putative tetratricopeptide-like helical domain superfamily [Helianthus annuus]KAJ0717927.1 putative tetratricopeptide-like helical domain superfamily [Helianthus annuus]KAJ0896293.1 putative tetratricopeptide-like helical domain superfamily [Helianthus annuus]